MKKVISWIFVVLWMIIIFCFSNMDATNSSKVSDGLIKSTASTVVNASNKLGISNIDTNGKKFNTYISKLSTPVRKTAHFTLYFILALLVINALKASKVNKHILIYTLIICVIYAFTDEFHQLFINGRSGEIKDVLIDCCGSLLGIILVKLRRKE